MTHKYNNHLKNNCKRDRCTGRSPDSSRYHHKRNNSFNLSGSYSSKFNSDKFDRCSSDSDDHSSEIYEEFSSRKCGGCNRRDCNDCSSKRKCKGCNYKDCYDCSSRDKHHDRSSRDKCRGCNYSHCDDCRPAHKCRGCDRKDCRDCFDRHKCGKCHRHRCKCIEHVSCYKTRCGHISIKLERSSNPEFFTAASQNITFIYTITNTGSEPICDPIRICDDFLGDQIINCNFIYPCTSQTFVRTYTVTPSDITRQRIESCAIAYVEVDCRKWVTSEPVPLVITYGSADVFGTMTQVRNGSIVNATVTLSNSTTSASAAENVTLSLTLPAGVTNVVAGIPAPVIGTNSVYMSIPTLAIGSSAAFNFSYTPASLAPGAAYTFDGVVTASTYDPNLSNNNVVSTIIM